jgi:hypothetical protein
MRRRLRTFTLRTGTLLCLLITVAFVVSGFCSFGIDIKGGPLVWVLAGTVWFGLDDMRGAQVVFFRPRQFPRWLWLTFGWSPWVGVPLVAILLAVAVPTLLVWRFVPKFPPGHCRRCGYNLKGLTQPRCPECGASFELKGDA